MPFACVLLKTWKPWPRCWKIDAPLYSYSNTSTSHNTKVWMSGIKLWKKKLDDLNGEFYESSRLMTSLLHDCAAYKIRKIGKINKFVTFDSEFIKFIIFFLKANRKSIQLKTKINLQSRRLTLKHKWYLLWKCQSIHSLKMQDICRIEEFAGMRDGRNGGNARDGRQRLQKLLLVISAMTRIIRHIKSKWKLPFIHSQVEKKDIVGFLRHIHIQNGSERVRLMASFWYLLPFGEDVDVQFNVQVPVRFGSNQRLIEN